MKRALAILFAACSDTGPDLITRIDTPRLLAMPSEPSVLDVDGEVRVAPVIVDAAGPRTGDAVALRACSPWRFVTEPATDCAGADALPIEASPDGSFTITTAQLLAAFPPPDGTPADAASLAIAIEAGLEPRIPLIAEVVIDGELLVARRDLHVVVDAAELANPRLVEVRFDGVPMPTPLRAGERHALTLVFDPESFDPADPDPDDPDDDRLERFDCYFYSPHGELSEHEIDIRDARLSIETPPNDFTAGAAGTSWLFVVVTDRTGGMSADAVPLVIQ